MHSVAAKLLQPRSSQQAHPIRLRAAVSAKPKARTVVATALRSTAASSRTAKPHKVRTGGTAVPHSRATTMLTHFMATGAKAVAAKAALLRRQAGQSSSGSLRRTGQQQQQHQQNTLHAFTAGMR